MYGRSSFVGKNEIPKLLSEDVNGGSPAAETSTTSTNKPKNTFLSGLSLNFFKKSDVSEVPSSVHTYREQPSLQIQQSVSDLTGGAGKSKTPEKSGAS